jgi:UDP-3-O-[3-hydroxymyristoyl] N-acetylglucosamine deacetylase
MIRQNSIKESTSKIEGVNIFNGRENYVRFHPAEDNSGLVFRVGREEIPVNLENASHYKTWRGLPVVSCISMNGVRKKAIKVEHLLSSVYSLGIDNLVIELSDGVCPRFDTSLEEIFYPLRDLRQEGTADKKYWRVKKGLECGVGTNNAGRSGDRLDVKSSENFVIDYHAFYPHRSIGEQNYRFEFSEKNYEDEIMSARGVFFLPFGSRYLTIESPLKCLHGVNDKNALLIGSKCEEDFVNVSPSVMGYGKSEFVRHKILDVIGTLAITGRQFRETEFSFDKTGHKFDLYSVGKLFSKGCFEWC